MSIEAAFLILSDLHFGNDLHESAEVQLLNIPGLFQMFSVAKLTDYFESRCRGHFEPCVKRLPRYLKTLLVDLKADGFERDDFDLTILLGDQSTLAHERSYKFLREYLSKESYETKDADGSIRCAGLAVDPENVIAVPGNHDKLLRSSLDLYNDEFTHKLGIRNQIQPQRSSIAVRTIAGREFVFILIDPSTYTSADLSLDKNYRSHLASGTVSPKLVEDVETKLSLLRQHRKLDADVKLSSTFEEAVKVLVVHYAVDEKRFQSGMDELLLPHECNGLGEFVDHLREKYQLSIALHGHLHQPLLYNFNGVQVISCSTSTRVDKDRKTGFFVMKVLDSGTVRAEHHYWTGVGYTLDPDKNLTRDVGRAPKRELAA